MPLFDTKYLLKDSLLPTELINNLSRYGIVSAHQLSEMIDNQPASLQRVTHINPKKTRALLSDHFSVVALLQALELIQRLLENPTNLPEGFTTEKLNSLQMQISDHLPAEVLEQLNQPVPDYLLDGLILEQQPPIDLKGQCSQEELIDKDGQSKVDAVVDNKKPDSGE